MAAEESYARTSEGSIELDPEDRAFLEAQLAANKVANRSARGSQRLSYASIFCIIVNRMVGTGIFRTPTIVIDGTQSVGVSLLFWLCGAIAAIAGTFIYVEYGLTTPRVLINGVKMAVPRNGGELNYLQYVIQQPEYLSTCIFGLSFILLGNMAGNAIYFGELMFIAAEQPAPNGAVRGIAIAVTGFACIIHSIWRKGGIWLNNIFGGIKIVILLFVIVIGFCALGGVFNTNNASHNLSTSTSFADASSNTYGYVEGFLAIIFAYGGFNQANYVLGEIDQPRKKFKRTSFAAVGTVCVLYMLVNIAYMIVVRKEDQLGAEDVALLFFKNTLGESVAPRVFTIFVAISSLGNIIVMTFTAARVKQEIAKEGILPFAKLIGQSTNVFGRVLNKLLGRPPSAPTTEATPVGSLVLHWIFSVILILATWRQTPEAAYQTLVTLYSYAIDATFGFAISVGMLYLRFSKSSNGKSWKEKSPVNHYFSIFAALVFAIANAYPLIASWVPPSGSSSDQTFLIPDWPWYATPAVGWSLLFCGVIYWIVFRFVVPHIGRHKGKVLLVERQPFFHIEHGYYVQWHEIVSFNWVLRGHDNSDREY